MVFSSSLFVFLFLPCVLFFYYIVFKNRLARNILLLIMSLLFYAWGERIFVLILCVSILGNYFFALGVDAYRQNKNTAKLLIVFMIIFNIGILYIFKYLGFTARTITFLTGQELTVPSIALPIGISFFTFQAISYVIDVYRGTVPVQKNLFLVALYISFFPQLVAGPIIRYNTIADQLEERKENFQDFSYGCTRFVIGLCKKLLIANQLALLADDAFSMNAGGGELPVSLAWLGALAYTFQIYFDFSGYSDMAIGLGRMFGFKYLENFNYPYIAKTITEFWRRWHISLGMWFRDYVYFPLGGSRDQSTLRLVRNLFIVWLLTGIWHGASVSFIAWGLLYFCFLTAEKLIAKRNQSPSIVTYADQQSLPVKAALHIYTLIVVVLGWVLFRAPEMQYAWDYLKSMFGLAGNALINDLAVFQFNEYIVLLVIATVFCTPVIKNLFEKTSRNLSGQIIFASLISILFVFAVTYMVKETYNPFIYFNF